MGLSEFIANFAVKSYKDVTQYWYLMSGLGLIFSFPKCWWTHYFAVFPSTCNLVDILWWRRVCRCGNCLIAFSFCSHFFHMLLHLCIYTVISSNHLSLYSHSTTLLERSKILVNVEELCEIAKIVGYGKNYKLPLSYLGVQICWVKDHSKLPSNIN